VYWTPREHMQFGRLAASCAFGDRRAAGEAARDDCIRDQPPPDQASALATRGSLGSSGALCPAVPPPLVVAGRGGRRPPLRRAIDQVPVTRKTG
jgi:hypothetical protein